MVFCNTAPHIEHQTDTEVTILILIDGFLQYISPDADFEKIIVTILILIDGFLQFNYTILCQIFNMVTILILIDGFLQ